jgi:hypothetical protein
MTDAATYDAIMLFAKDTQIDLYDRLSLARFAQRRLNHRPFTNVLETNHADNAVELHDWQHGACRFFHTLHGGVKRIILLHDATPANHHIPDPPFASAFG